MTKRWNAMTRKLAPLLAAGMLLQAGGCELNADTLATGLIASIANDLIAGIVFGALGLV